MATGAPDANGIWIYGEDDSEATFSALLNKLGSSTSTKIGQLNNNGRILQVVEGVKNDTSAVTSTTFVDTGLSASITPSSTTSRILVIVSFAYSTSSTSFVPGFTIANAAGTNLIPATSPGFRAPSISGDYPFGTALMAQESFQFIHSPSTTSSYTYKLQARSSSGTMYLNRSGTDPNDGAWMRGVSRIILMEIK